MVWAVAAIALLGGAWVSRVIRRRSREALADAGPGDPPGSSDRGPEGIKM